MEEVQRNQQYLIHEFPRIVTSAMKSKVASIRLLSFIHKQIKQQVKLFGTAEEYSKMLTTIAPDVTIHMSECEVWLPLYEKIRVYIEIGAGEDTIDFISVREKVIDYLQKISEYCEANDTSFGIIHAETQEYKKQEGAYKQASDAAMYHFHACNAYFKATKKLRAYINN